MTQTTNIPIITPETREALVTGAAATEVVGSTVVAERQAEAVRALLAASQGALAQLEGMRGLLNLKENARSLNLTHNLSPDSLLEAVIRGDSIPLVGRAGSTPTARGTKAESFVAWGL